MHFREMQHGKIRDLIFTKTNVSRYLHDDYSIEDAERHTRQFNTPENLHYNL